MSQNSNLIGSAAAFGNFADQGSLIERQLNNLAATYGSDAVKQVAERLEAAKTIPELEEFEKLTEKIIAEINGEATRLLEDGRNPIALNVLDFEVGDLIRPDIPEIKNKLEESTEDSDATNEVLNAIDSMQDAAIDDAEIIFALQEASRLDCIGRATKAFELNSCYITYYERILSPELGERFKKLTGAQKSELISRVNEESDGHLGSDGEIELYFEYERWALILDPKEFLKQVQEKYGVKTS